jgi:hypothetical protein
MEILPKRYTLIATPTKGAIAIKAIPKNPPDLAAMTIDPAEKTTTMKVPITSAKNFF